MKESEQMRTKMNSIFRILAIICIGLITQQNTGLAGAKKIPYNLDSVAKALAENVIDQIKQREAENQYFRSIGAIGSVDFVIDMRKWHLSKESPALASSPFLSADQKNSLNAKLNGFYDEYRHPVYVVLSPIILGSNEVSGQAIKDVFDYFKIPWSDIEKLKERYREYLKDLQKFKGTTSPVSGSVSAGAILTVQSFIFYKSDLKEWRIRYGSDFTVSEDVKRANFIEEEYKKALDQNASKFDFVGKRYIALDNYATTIISAFKNNCLSTLKQKELNDILTLNLAELNKPILIKVKGPKSWPLENRAFYLDPREQEKNESLLKSTSGGALYFKVDDEGYININEIFANEQRASPEKVIEIVIALDEFLLSVSLLWDIYNNSGEYSDLMINGKPKSELLLEEAKDGEVTDQQLLFTVIELRRKLVDKIQLDMLSVDELRVSINLLFSVQEALKYTFGPESLYPFPQIQDLKKVKTPALHRYKIEPANSDEELLKQLEYLYNNERESLTDFEINLYFDLLCLVRGDCRDRKYEDHHMIPVEVSTHDLVVAARKCVDKFIFNGKDNFIKLEKYVKDTGDGRHGNHPEYNRWINELLNNLLIQYRNRNGQGPVDPCTAKDLLLDLIEETIKPAIDEDPNETINELGRRKLLGK
jgi:hypothetical protein